METASIAHTAYVNQIPYITIRTVSDTAKDAGEDNFFKNLPMASAISKDTVLALLEELQGYCL
jgi:adenosylhomocysteine nucleosidase